MGEPLAQPSASGVSRHKGSSAVLPPVPAPPGFELVLPAELVMLALPAMLVVPAVPVLPSDTSPPRQPLAPTNDNTKPASSVRDKTVRVIKDMCSPFP